jgi:hypothetical protein
LYPYFFTLNISRPDPRFVTKEKEMIVFELISTASLVVAVATLAVSIYLNAQRKKEITAVGALVQTLDTKHELTTSTLQADIRKTEGNLHSDISSVRSFAESKALRNVVVVSTSDHGQIVTDNRR